MTAAGLSDAEVAQRVADGKTNDVPDEWWRVGLVSSSAIAYLVIGVAARGSGERTDRCRS